MSLNIKDEQTHELVRELARVTGATQTAAVRDAVQRRLAELGADGVDGSEVVARRQRLQEIVAAFQDDLTDDDRRRMVSGDVWLYDDSGLPR